MKKSNHYFKRLYKYLNIPFQILAAVLILITTFLSMTAPLIIKLIIDDVITKQHYERLTTYGTILVVITLLTILIEFVQNFVINRTGEVITKKLREEVYEKSLELDSQTLKKITSANIISLFNNDIAQINTLIITFTTRFIVQIITLIIVITMLLIINVKLTIFSVITIPLYFLCFSVIKSKLQGLSYKRQNMYVSLNKHLQEDIQGIEVIQTLRAEEYKKNKFKDKLSSMFDISIKLSVVNCGLGQMASLVSSIGSIIVIWGGAIMTQSGSITIGTILAFTMYLGRLYAPILSLVSVRQSLHIAIPSLDRVLGFLNTRSLIEDNKAAINLDEKIQSIELKDIAINYGQNKDVVNHVNIEIKSGKVTAIVGESGSGKTSISRLLVRLIEPSEGQLLINGQDYKNYTISSLRSRIGLAMQNSILFTGTVRDNVKFNLEEAEEPLVEEALDEAAATFVSELSDNIDTLIGESGFNISGGEKQRIALARTILREYDLVIYDEPTSSVDNITRKKLMDSIFKNKDKNNMSVIITHRLDDIEAADIIYVMEKGKVVGVGTHKDLLKDNSYYQNLYYAQNNSLNSKIG